MDTKHTQETVKVGDDPDNVRDVGAVVPPGGVPVRAHSQCVIEGIDLDVSTTNEVVVAEHYSGNGRKKDSD